MRASIRSARPLVARAARPGHRALVSQCATDFVRSKKTHALLSNRCRRALAGWDGHCPPRMDTCGVRLRSEQPRLLHMCRHARATPRYSSASDTRVHLLAGHSADSRSPAACGAPPASTRRRSSTAGVAGRSNWWLLLLWHAAMTSADSYVHSTHAGKAAAALCVSPSVLCAHVQQPNPVDTVVCSALGFFAECRFITPNGDCEQYSSRWQRRGGWSIVGGRRGRER